MLTGWLTNFGCIAQALSTPNQHVPDDHEGRAPASTVRLCVVAATEPSHTIVRLCRSLIFLRLTRMKNFKWRGKRRTSQGGAIGSTRGQNSPPKGNTIFVAREVCEYAAEAEARARTGRNSVGLKLIETNKSSTEATRYRSRVECTEVRHGGPNRSSRKTFFASKTLLDFN